VNEFVEECRSEWKRLGVPDPVANEMAADLEADLEEAETEGVSAEEVLGSGAYDPRSFATAWAAERGVVPRTPPNAHGFPRRARTVAVIGVFALIAVIGGVLVIVESSSGPTRLALTPGPAAISPDGRTIAYLRPGVVQLPAPPPGDLSITVDGTRLPGSVWISPVNTLREPATRIVSVDINDSGVDARSIGWVLLTVGLAGVVPLTMFSLWFGPGRRSRRLTAGTNLHD
jgi:hypothetical protein